MKRSVCERWNSARTRCFVLIGGCMIAALALSPPAAAQPGHNAGEHKDAERAARWRDIEIPYHREGLTAAEQQEVAKLADACRLLDEVYWHESDLGGLASYRATKSAVLEKLLDAARAKLATED